MISVSAKKEIMLFGTPLMIEAAFARSDSDRQVKPESAVMGGTWHMSQLARDTKSRCNVTNT